MSLIYTIRESQKAKHVSLKISMSGKLEVIIPQGFDHKRIPAIVQKKQQWIERVRQRVQTQQSLSNWSKGDTLPEQIALAAIAETWQVQYRSAKQPGYKEQSSLKLTVYGDTTNQSLCKHVLQQWVAHKARLYLVPWLDTVSQEVELPYTRATIRQQKTLWGSCSERQTISLNCKLLFLPAQLVRYVFIHELCHTIHLNHSSKFWALVGRYEPNYQELDASLQDARYLVPAWMEKD